MLDFLFLFIAMAGGEREAGADATAVAAATELVAEDQTPTGRFLTATEVKPILAATRNNWVAIQVFDGVDHLYVTHLWSWRCGLLKIELSVNGGPMEPWPLPPCREDSAQPTAILDEDGFPLRRYPGTQVERVIVRITYDDLSVEEAEFERRTVLIPG